MTGDRDPRQEHRDVANSIGIAVALFVAALCIGQIIGILWPAG